MGSERPCGAITVEEIEGTLGRRSLTTEEFAEALKHRADTGCSLGEALVKMGLLTRAELTSALAEYRLADQPPTTPGTE